MSFDEELRAINTLATIRVLAVEIGQGMPSIAPPSEWFGAIEDSANPATRARLQRSYDARLTLTMEVASICTHVALGDVSLQKAHGLMRRALVALSELGKDRRDLVRLVRRRAAEGFEVAS